MTDDVSTRPLRRREGPRLVGGLPFTSPVVA